MKRCLRTALFVFVAVAALGAAACVPQTPLPPPDTTPPVLSLPADITVAAQSPSGATVTWAATAIDNKDGAVPVDCTPSSGSLLAVGSTTVDCSVTDAAGNTANGSFTVTVTPLPEADNANLRRVTPIAIVGVSGNTYTFTYVIKNLGPAACIPQLVIVLHRTLPSWLVSDTYDVDVCLDTNQEYRIERSASLTPGHWYYSAQWKGSHGDYDYHFFQDPLPVEYQVDVP
jgi:hypothetical protein